MAGEADAVTRWIAERLLTGSIHAGILIGLLWLLFRLFPTIPASLQTAGWWLVTLKLLLTLMPLPPVSIPLLPPAARWSGSTSAIPVDSPGLASAYPAETYRRRPGLTAERVGSPKPGEISRFSWISALIGVWLLGLIMHAIRLLMAFRTARSIQQRSESSSLEDIALLRRLADRIGLRVPRVRTSHEIDAPQVLGIHRPTILIPTDAAASLTASERAIALAHELMHVRRRDLLLGWVPVLAQAIFFFHPLVRLAVREYLVAREAACDAAVVRAFDVTPDEIGRLLLRIGVRRAVPGFAAGGASSSMSLLRRRLVMLQYMRCTRAPRLVRWCAAVGACLLIVPFELAATTPSASPESLARLAEQPDRGTPPAPGPQAGPRAGLPALSQIAVPPPLRQREQAGSATRVEKEIARQQQRAGEDLRQPLAVRKQAAQRESQQESRDVLALRARLEATRRSLQEQSQILREMKRRHAHAQEEAKRALQDVQESTQRLEVLHLQLALAQRALEQQQQQVALVQRAAGTEAQSGGNSQSYSRGDVVHLTHAPDGIRPADVTILAVPGDTLHVSRAGVIVDGTRVTTLSAEFVAGLPEEPWEEVVPAGHYFVAAEQRSDSSATRFWGLIPAKRIAGKR